MIATTVSTNTSKQDQYYDNTQTSNKISWEYASCHMPPMPPCLLLIVFVVRIGSIYYKYKYTNINERLYHILLFYRVRTQHNFDL